MDGFMKMMMGREAAVRAAQHALPEYIAYAAARGWEVKSDDKWFCIQMKMGTCEKQFVVSISYCKKMEWGLETEAIELALLDELGGTVIYDDDADYSDVCVFEGIDEVKTELARLYDHYNKESVQCDDPVAVAVVGEVAQIYEV